MRQSHKRATPTPLRCLTRALTRPQGKKAELKRFIIDLSKQYSILSQFTSFVAVEERVCAVRFLHTPGRSFRGVQPH